MNLLEMIGLGRLSFIVQTDEAPPTEYPCGVRGCDEPQTIIDQNARTTTVECAAHSSVTTWDTTPRDDSPQRVIRPRDNWRQYGVKPPNPKK